MYVLVSTRKRKTYGKRKGNSGTSRDAVSSCGFLPAAICERAESGIRPPYRIISTGCLPVMDLEPKGSVKHQVKDVDWL